MSAKVAMGTVTVRAGPTHRLRGVVSLGRVGDISVRLEVDRNDLHQTRIVESEVSDLADGEALLRVDGVGLTANNITYAVFGDMLGYWQFFPSEDPWGQVPAWGFADVVDA